MLYAIISEDVADSLQKRLSVRPEHIKRLQTLQDEGRLIIAGPHPAIDAENPGIMKHFPEMSFVFSEANFSKMNVYFTSDLSGQESMQVLKPLTKGGWGQFNWGQQPWNGNVLGQQTRIRTLVPSAFQRANWISVRLTLNQCFTSFGFSGMSVAINEMGSRQKGAGQ